jgi:phosphonate transport system ATP-binding protein
VTFDLQGVTVRHRASTGQEAGVLSDLTLSIDQGEQIALIGPSGAGKTTLLHTLACAHRPESGSLKVFDADPWSLGTAERHALRAKLFLAPQTPPLPPRQRVVTAVLAGRLPQWSFWQALRSLVKPTETNTAHEALARFDLQDKLYARVDRLSGGERQRCGLARLLLSSAEALLVDEPLSALDPALSELTIATLRREAAERQATLICTLHQVDLALAHFPRIVALKNGRVVFDLPRAQVTQDMITELYQGEHPPALPLPKHGEHQAPLAVGGCL